MVTPVTPPSPTLAKVSIDAAVTTTETTTAPTAPPTTTPSRTTVPTRLPTAQDACMTMVTRTYDAMYGSADAIQTWSDAFDSGELPERATFLRLGFSLTFEPNPASSGRYDFWLESLGSVADRRLAEVRALSPATYDVCSPLLEHWTPAVQDVFLSSHLGNQEGEGHWNPLLYDWHSYFRECSQLLSVNLAEACPPATLP